MGFSDEIDAFRRKLNDKVEQIAALNGKPLEDFLTPAFMEAQTHFSSLAHFFESAGFPEWRTVEGMKAIPDNELDAFVQSNTPWENWRAMQIAAAQEAANRIWSS